MRFEVDGELVEDAIGGGRGERRGCLRWGRALKSCGLAFLRASDR